MAVAEDPWQIAQSDEVRRAGDRELRRRVGAYYTPQAVARAVVRRALRPLCEGRSPAELRQLRILDPACGSGVFLLASLEILQERGLTPQEATSCLVGYDSDPLAITAAIRALQVQAGAVPRLEVRDPLLETPEPRFAAIVGNPPWAKVARDDPRKPRIEALFADIRQGEFNLNSLFLWWALQSLEPGGRLVFLTPSTWLLNRWDSKLRRVVLEHRVEEVALLPAGTFSSAPTMVPACVVIQKSPPGGTVHLSAGAWRSEAVPGIWRQRPHGEMSVYDDDAFARLWVRATRRSRPLGDSAIVSDGIYTSTARRFATAGPRSPADRPVLLAGKELGRDVVCHGGAYLPQVVWQRHQKAQDTERLVLHAARNPALRLRLQGAVVPKGVFVSNRFINVRSDLDPWFLAAVLLSAPINGLYARRFPVADIDAFMLGQIPVPDLGAQEQARLGALARLRAQLTRALVLQIAARAPAARELAEVIATLSWQLDEAVSSALDLGPLDRAWLRWQPESSRVDDALPRHDEKARV